MRTSHRLGVAAFVIAAGAALFTGCSKNEAASSACGATVGGELCESCCKANGASGYKYVSSCSCLGGGGGAPAPAPVSGSTTNFAGNYNSTFGRAVVTQTGSSVNIAYARGTASCTAAGNALDCSWREAGNLAGKAKLVRETSGTLRGTWGNGVSDSNGGAWVFTPGT